MEQTRIARVVLDVLKPHEPPLTEFALYLKELVGIKRVEVSVDEIDDRTQSLQVILTGNIEYEALRLHLAVKGAAIHSVDSVIVVSSR
jgi:uncharacterized protein